MMIMIMIMTVCLTRSQKFVMYLFSVKCSQLKISSVAQGLVVQVFMSLLLGGSHSVWILIENSLGKM
jgi:hypothetical protein